jgi:Flp pilus assembly protein TadG
MITPRTDRGLRFWADEGGTLLALFAILALVILGLTGMVVDIGIGYVSKARMSRAVDAGVLAGARSLRNGQPVARAQALALAESNGVSSAGGVSLDVVFGVNADGESTVSMTAFRQMPTFFLKALGMTELDIGSAATAAVPPVDLVLVLDQSGSLGNAGAFDDLQDAAKAFLSHFDEDLDQLGLVSFQLNAKDRFLIDGQFKAPIEGQINAMASVGDTNIGEGLRLALAQMKLPTVRERSVKAVVFFTDGRPTAFRGLLGPGGPIDGGSSLGPFIPAAPGVQDRILAVPTASVGRVVGYFDDPDNLPIDGLEPPSGCAGAAQCWGWDDWLAREKAKDAGLEVANALRSDGIHIYSIGLGNRTAPPAEHPDMDYLSLLANEDGAADGDQPRGRAYFAPSADELEAVFRQVAEDLFVRLAQ